MLRDRIQANYLALTPAFRRLADFVLEHFVDVAFMTATDVADAAGSNTSTVVRFAQALGYAGFREMVQEAQQVVRDELLAVRSLPEIEGDMGLISAQMEAERRQLKLMQIHLLEQPIPVLSLLASARRAWVTGQGAGAHLAALGALMLRDSGVDAAAVAPDALEAAVVLHEIGPQDLLLGLSLTRSEPAVAGTVDFARQRGAKTLVLSPSPVTVAALASETILLCAGESPTTSHPLVSVTALMAALSAAFAARYPERRPETADGPSNATALLAAQARWWSD
jgi:DNA-binding MurR/RpiR family transcriptional regulator